MSVLGWLCVVVLSFWVSTVLVWLILAWVRPVDCVNCCDSGEWRDGRGTWCWCSCPAGQRARAEWDREVTA